MRVWSLDPALLDRQALVAGWREALLVQKVLAGRTRGYTHHPQLERFRAAPDPTGAVAAYLRGLADEAERRGYRFNASLIQGIPTTDRLPVTEGQLAYELRLLRAKAEERSPEWAPRLAGITPEPHPLFRVGPGDIEPWERVRPEIL